MTNQSIAEKIKKLIKKADSTTHEEEADTFMQKAEALMLKHGLDLLALGQLDSEDPMGTDMEVGHCFASAAWRKLVAAQLITYYGGAVVFTRQKNKTYFSISGRESARVTYQLMAPFVDRQVLNLARHAVRRGEFKTASQAQTAIGNALALRIAGLIHDREDREAATGVKGMNALVPVDMLEAEMLRAFPGLSTGRKRSVRTTAAARDAADKVSLNRATKADPAAKRLS